MIKEEAIQGNRLIATFMGATFVPDWKPIYQPDAVGFPTFVYEGVPFPTPTSCKNWGVEQLQYHESWDWLMPVVEKIETISFEVFNECGVNIYKKTCFINSGGWNNVKIVDIYDEKQKYTKISATWLAVVEFVKYYNEKNGKQEIQAEKSI